MWEQDGSRLLSLPHHHQEARGPTIVRGQVLRMSQTSFSHISINSPSILTVSMATESP